MMYDKKTMSRLDEELYGNTKPKEKSILVDSLLTTKVVGYGINDIEI